MDRCAYAAAMPGLLPSLSVRRVALGQADINRRPDVDLFYRYVGTQIPALPNIAPSPR